MYTLRDRQPASLEKRKHVGSSTHILCCRACLVLGGLVGSFILITAETGCMVNPKSMQFVENCSLVRSTTALCSACRGIGCDLRFRELFGNDGPSKAAQRQIPHRQAQPKIGKRALSSSRLAKPCETLMLLHTENRRKKVCQKSSQKKKNPQSAQNLASSGPKLGSFQLI